MDDNRLAVHVLGRDDAIFARCAAQVLDPELADARRELKRRARRCERADRRQRIRRGDDELLGCRLGDRHADRLYRPGKLAILPCHAHRQVDAAGNARDAPRALEPADGLSAASLYVHQPSCVNLDDASVVGTKTIVASQDKRRVLTDNDARCANGAPVSKRLNEAFGDLNRRERPGPAGTRIAEGVDGLEDAFAFLAQTRTRRRSALVAATPSVRHAQRRALRHINYASAAAVVLLEPHRRARRKRHVARLNANARTVEVVGRRLGADAHVAFRIEDDSIAAGWNGVLCPTGLVRPGTKSSARPMELRRRSRKRRKERRHDKDRNNPSCHFAFSLFAPGPPASSPCSTGCVA